MEKLDFLIENSGDSILENYNYSKGALTISLKLDELNEKISLKIKTDELSFNNYFLDKTEDLYKTCRVEILELSNILSMENGIYIPSSDFGKLMNEKKLDYHLAYGEKQSTCKFIFSLVGYERLVSCLISDLDSIVVVGNVSGNG